MMTRQNSDSNTPGSDSGPSVSAEPFPCMMMPALYSPTSAMKNPIPADMASFMDCGISSSILILQPVTVKAKNITPDMNTISSPCSKVNPIVRHMV